MTVNELKQLLEQVNGNMEVKIVSDYGDRCNTKQSLDIKYIAIGNEKNSAYSDSGRAVKENNNIEDEEIEEIDNEPKYLFLSSEYLNLPVTFKT